MTIEVPTPSADLIFQIETATIDTELSEVAAIAAIRERFTQYSKHNGYIRIADYEMANSNYRVDRELFYKQSGKQVKGLLCCDDFSTDHTDQNRGNRIGTRLYLTESGDWLQLVREGHWTQWQGEAQWWGCGVSAAPGADDNGYSDPALDVGGEIKILTDSEVSDAYHLDAILNDLAKSMAEMCKKLPDRYGKLKVRAELAGRVLAEVK